MKTLTSIFVFALLFFVAGMLSTCGQTVTLTSVADTGIEQSSANSNFGGDATAVSGALGAAANHAIRRMLLRFNLSGRIPAGAIINSASLSVQVVRVPRTPVNSTFGLRRLLANWTETGATWNSRLPGASWQIAGATGTADAARTPSSSVLVSGLGNYVFPSATALVADVQAWSDNPATNFGWLLISADENSFETARHFATRESGAQAPVLTVSYTLPPLAIVQQPQSQTVIEGAPAQFSVSASGPLPISYQWLFNGTNMPGATNATLNLGPVTLASAGSYTVIVSHSSNSLISAAAVLTVRPLVLPTPNVNFIAPTNGARFPANTGIDAAVDASVSNSIIRQVEFSLGTNIVGTVTNSPFSLVLTNLVPGNYQLSARATASTGTSNTAVVSFTVLTPLSIGITQPAAGARFPLGSNIVLQVAVPATAPVVTNVDFFAGNTLVGEASIPALTLNWTPAQANDYVLTAVALDEFGGTATSAPVSIRVFIPEAEPPTIRITNSPPDFAHVSQATVFLAGVASDNVGLDRVEARVNNGSFQTVTGTSSWSADIRLAPGLNIVQVRSVDLAGNTSEIATRFFTFVQNLPLVVQTEGQGTVTPDLNGHLLEVGKAYKIRAKPASGQLFAGWVLTAANVTNAVQPNAVLNFTMQSNLTLTAEFVPNPFAPVQGSYAGLILNTNAPAPESSGVFTLRVSGGGAFSGRFVLQGKSFPISGQFDLGGNVNFAIIRPGNRPVAVSLSLDLTNGTEVVRGTATDGTWTALLVANRNVFNAKTNPAPEAGIVPFRLQIAGTAVQEGTGVAKISSSGQARITGTMVDGRVFSFGTTIGKDGSAPFYVLSKSGDEMLAGWVDFAPVISGRVYWVRAAAGGFSVPLDVVPAGQ